MTIFKGFKKRGRLLHGSIADGHAGVVASIDSRTAAERKAESVAASVAARRHEDSRARERKETGGPKGLEPTRYGDWEKAGRCIDF